MVPKTFGETFVGLMRPKWEDMHSVTSGVKLTQHYIKTHILSGGMVWVCTTWVLQQANDPKPPSRSTSNGSEVDRRLWSGLAKVWT